MGLEEVAPFIGTCRPRTRPGERQNRTSISGERAGNRCKTAVICALKEQAHASTDAIEITILVPIFLLTGWNSPGPTLKRPTRRADGSVSAAPGSRRKSVESGL